MHDHALDASAAGPSAHTHALDASAVGYAHTQTHAHACT